MEENKLEESRNLLFPIADRNTTELGAEAQYLLAKLAFTENNLEQALEEYAKVKVLFEAFDTWVAAALFEAAQIHLQLGNTGEAAGMLNEITDRYPGTPTATKASSLIEQRNF